MAFRALTRLPPLGTKALEMGDRKESVGLEYRPALRAPPSMGLASPASPAAAQEEVVGLGVLRRGADASDEEDEFFTSGGDRAEAEAREDGVVEMACREEENDDFDGGEAEAEEAEEAEVTSRGASTAM